MDILAPVQIGSADGGAEAQASITGEVLDNSFSSDGNLPLLERFGVGLRGASAKLTALGGAGITLTGRDLGGEQLAVYLASSAPASVDMSLGGALRIDGDSNVRIGGQIVAGSALSISAGQVLAIDAAELSGNPGSVLLNANGVTIGSGGQPTRLAFGSATTLGITGNYALIGNFDSNLIDNGGGNQNVEGQAGNARSRALAGEGVDGQVSASGTSISTGGAISIQAVNLGLGANASVQSLATGTAITVSGLGFSGAGQAERKVALVDAGNGGSMMGFF